MEITREGGCACGEVRYRLTSDPLFTHCCHCLKCQRQTSEYSRPEVRFVRSGTLYDTKSLWPAASLERLAAVIFPAG